MWNFEFSLGMCSTERQDLVHSLEYLVSNGRQVLLGGIRLGGSATHPWKSSKGGNNSFTFIKFLPILLICFLFETSQGRTSTWRSGLGHGHARRAQQLREKSSVELGGKAQYQCHWYQVSLPQQSRKWPLVI